MKIDSDYINNIIISTELQNYNIIATEYIKNDIILLD